MINFRFCEILILESLEIKYLIFLSIKFRKKNLNVRYQLR